VIVVPGSSTSPFGSSPPARIECDMAESANPATSALWHRPHPVGSIDSNWLFVGLEIGVDAPPDWGPIALIRTCVRAVNPVSRRTTSRLDTSEISRLAVIGADRVQAKVDLWNEKSLQEAPKGDKNAMFRRLDLSAGVRVIDCFPRPPSLCQFRSKNGPWRLYGPSGLSTNRMDVVGKGTT
jgi:hypothetical protein